MKFQITQGKINKEMATGQIFGSSYQHFCSGIMGSRNQDFVMFPISSIVESTVPEYYHLLEFQHQTVH